jgi:hypothetical protein
MLLGERKEDALGRMQAWVGVSAFKRPSEVLNIPAGELRGGTFVIHPPLTTFWSADIRISIRRMCPIARPVVGMCTSFACLR